MSDANVTKGLVSGTLGSSEFMNSMLHIAVGCVIVLFVLILLGKIIEAVGDNYSFSKKCCKKCNRRGFFGFFELKTGDYLCKKCVVCKKFRCIGCKKQFELKEANIFERDYYCMDCYKRYYRTFQRFNFRLEFAESKTFLENPNREFCGVEIECLNKKRDRNCFTREELKEYKVNQYEDGSLSKGGVEFSTFPSNGDDFFNRIRNFCKVLIKRQYYTNATCGLHMHLQTAQDVDLIKKIIVFYYKFEKFFYSYVSEKRRNSGFCSPISKKYELKQLEDIMKCNDIYDLKRALYGKFDLGESKSHGCSRRYCWLNLHSIFYRGTLEFRSHGGTVSPKKILNWAKIHLKIRRYLNETSIDKLIKLEGNEQELFRILKDNSLKRYIQRRINLFSDITQKEYKFIEPNQKGLEVIED